MQIVSVNIAINSIIIAIVAYIAFIILNSKAYSTIAILNSMVIGLVSVVSGAAFIYYFDGVDTVFEQLVLKNVGSFGRFVMAGYGCIISTLVCIILKIFIILKKKIA